MSAPTRSGPWSVEQVLALAPDASSLKAGRGLGTGKPWSGAGQHADGTSVWGLCAGSGSKPYQTAVDLTEPAYRCSCPSRKFPCKHALGLLLLWAAGGLADQEPPEWVTQWQSSRVARQEKAATRVPAPPSEKSRRQRAGRVDAGLDELDRWLTDQIRAGLAGAGSAGYAHWERMSARLIDAQAPGLAGTVHRLAGVAGSPDRLLAELALLRLAVAGYRRIDELPEPLAATVRSRIGFPVSTDEVIAEPAVPDRWLVTAVTVEVDERLSTQRVWLRGLSGRRPALVLNFAAGGQPLPADLPLGAVLDADVHYYPGAQPLRALVGSRGGLSTVESGAVEGDAVATALDGWASALAADPWLERWPMLLAEVVPVHDGGWHLIDAKGDALPLDPGVPAPWPLVAACGGTPVTVAVEYTPRGVRPLTCWVRGRLIRL